MSLGQRLARLERAVGLTDPCPDCGGRRSTKFIVESGGEEEICQPRLP